MSAIFGIIDFKNRPIDPAWITSMQTDLAHRGPDGQRIYQEKSMFFGHMLLQVTPESVYDTSPYEEDEFVITAYARLDEREAIMNRLNIPQIERDSITDPLLLLRSFRKFGKDFVKDIYGDFAFAIWDKNKKELFCARDQMGIKPFLYYFQDNRFIFSTEIKSIVKLEIVDTAIDNIYLRDHAIGIYNKVENTTWKNIYLLRKACKLSFKEKKILINQYWFPKYKLNKKYKTEDDSSKELLSILKNIIADHTRSIGNIGADLSGGLDSSTIVCLASEQLLKQNKYITTVSSVYEPEYSNALNPDEKEYIDEVIKNIPNIHPIFVYRSNFNFWKGLIKKYEKSFNPAWFFYYIQDAMLSEYEKKNIKRVMIGHPGDCTISNTTINPFTILLCSGRIRRLIKLIRVSWDSKNQSLFQFVKSNILIELIPWHLQKFYFKLRKVKFYDYDDLSYFPYNFDINKKNKIKKEIIKANFSSSLKEKHISQHIWPQNYNVIDKESNCTSSQYKIEMTYPFTDRRLVEFLLQIPVEHFYAKGLKRGLIRHTLKGILPHKIETRKTKGEFSPGHVEIYRKDILEICGYLANTNIDFYLKKSIDIEKLKKLILNLKSVDKNTIFTFKKWSLFDLVQILLFNQKFKTYEKRIEKLEETSN